MRVVFDNCAEAQKRASAEKSYGIFHSKQNNPNFNIHTHDSCEILLCVSGGKNFLIDDKVYSINDGDVFVMNQFEAHKITFLPDCEVERYTAQIHPQFIFSASTDMTDLSQCFYMRKDGTSNRIPLSSEESEHIRGLFEEFSKESSYGDDIIKNTVMIRILTFLNEKFLTCCVSSPDRVQNVPLNKAILYINEHLSDDLTLEKIAKCSYVSVNQLCKLFKSTLGTTVLKYIIGKRISQAKKYLKSGKSVSETAFLCGFNDYSNFIRTFKKEVGISPGKYYTL